MWFCLRAQCTIFPGGAAYNPYLITLCLKEQAVKQIHYIYGPRGAPLIRRYRLQCDTKYLSRPALQQVSISAGRQNQRWETDELLFSRQKCWEMCTHSKRPARPFCTSNEPGIIVAHFASTASREMMRRLRTGKVKFQNVSSTAVT